LVRTLAIAAVLAVATAAAAPTAHAEDPPLVNWPALLPSLASGFTPATFNICPDGSPRCLDHTLREMNRRVAVHDRDCNDNALFIRNYQLVTRFYLGVAGTGFFQDDVYLAREDAIFAQLYFDAEDAWRAGRGQDVPEAWRIAFEAADKKQVQGAGNLLLGINAHVQRDQPYMVAGLGLVSPDGKSRKPDHDKFNELLNTAYDDVIAQAVKYDDPTVDDTDVPGTQADNFALFQIIAGWREGVWRNAERLVGARSDAERKLVAQEIEQNAAMTARQIRDQFTYRPPYTRAQRDALCPERRARGTRALQSPQPAPRPAPRRRARRARDKASTTRSRARCDGRTRSSRGHRRARRRSRASRRASRSCRARRPSSRADRRPRRRASRRASGRRP
jgi:Family of unknown function (DUF5995)